MSFLGDIAPIIGLASSLFGGSTQSQNQPSPAQTGAIPPYVAAYLQQAYPWLSSQIGQFQPYNGQLQVPMSSLSQQSYQNQGMLGGLTGPAAGGALGNILGMNLDPTQNPVVQNMIAAIQGSTNQQMSDQLQALHAQYGMMSPVGGSYGSGYAAGQGQLVGNLLTGEQSTIANLLNSIYGQNLANQQTAIGQGLNMPQIGNTLGGSAQSLQQQNLQNQYANYQNNLQQMWNALNPITSLGSAVSSPGLAQFGPSPFAQAGQGLMSLLNTQNRGGSEFLNQPAVSGGSNGGFTTTDPGFSTGPIPSPSPGSFVTETP